MRFSIRGLMRCGLLLAVAPAAVATTWYVNGVSGSDTNKCLSATTACKTIGHAISFASSGDSIKVGPATYSEDLTIGINLNIVGSGAGTTIVAGNGFGTVITIPPGASVSVSALTITKGYGINGGGVYNRGILTITSSTIGGNIASCSNRGGCVVYGGGINNFGAVTINNSTISGNAAFAAGCVITGNICIGIGGGVSNRGTVTINNSTITGNSASFHCPGVTYCHFLGGGIYNDRGSTIRTSNATISGNGNGGGINNSGTVTLQNSILANSKGNCFGPVTSHGYNLSSDNSCSFAGPGDQNSTNPVLGPLQYNGGPTQTMALLSGSPAIDAGNPTGCTDSNGVLLKLDQRGYPRHDAEDSSGCDIGAYESQSD